MNLPFTANQFFDIIEQYNQAIFPFQLIIFMMGLIAVLVISPRKISSNRFIGAFLGVLWLWTGIAYHLIFFTSINRAAYAFGVLFILQGIFFLYYTFSKGRMVFRFEGKTKGYLGYFFVLFGLVIYPVISFLLENSVERTISPGLPCPSTILTFGFLMLADRKMPRFLLIIPSLWAIIGTGAAINFNVYQDYVLIVSAIIAVIFILSRKNR